MTITIRDVQALTYLATRLRAETHGCAKWDDAGTFAVIRELVGQNFGETIHRVIGHAMDPVARTPGAIRRPFVPAALVEPGRRQPAKAGEDCRRHPGEYVGSCRACAVQHIDHPEDPVLEGADRTAGRQLLEQIRARRHGQGMTQAMVDAILPDRPETACASDGCFRPTREGICDRCREVAITEGIAAGNAELVARLKAQQRQRPIPEPAAPGYFRAADIDHGRVHAAQARAAATRRETEPETDQPEEGERDD